MPVTASSDKKMQPLKQMSYPTTVGSANAAVKPLWCFSAWTMLTVRVRSTATTITQTGPVEATVSLVARFIGG